jgi:hypothetical protein
VSWAKIVYVPAVLEAVSVAVAWLTESAVVEAGEMLGPAADEDVNVTGSPEKSSPEASVRRAVTVACAEPSATSEFGVMLMSTLLG